MTKDTNAATATAASPLAGFMPPGFTPPGFDRLLAAWEQAASTATSALLRDPTVLELGARLMNANLAFSKAALQAVETLWAPLPGGERAR